MGSHINAAGEFQSDKYPTCPPGKVPLSVRDRSAWDLLWEYAQRRRSVDTEFSDDLEAALRAAGYAGPATERMVALPESEIDELRAKLTSTQEELQGLRPLAAVAGEWFEDGNECMYCDGVVDERPHDDQCVLVAAQAVVLTAQLPLAETDGA